MKKSRQELLTEQAQLDDLDYESRSNIERILKVLKRLHAAYLSEIAWEAGLTEYQARLLLNMMWHDDLIEEIPVDYYRADPRLIARVPDLSAKGQAGYNNFCKRRWFAITEAGRAYRA